MERWKEMGEVRMSSPSFPALLWSVQAYGCGRTRPTQRSISKHQWGCLSLPNSLLFNIDVILFVFLWFIYFFSVDEMPGRGGKLLLRRCGGVRRWATVRRPETMPRLDAALPADTTGNDGVAKEAARMGGPRVGWLTHTRLSGVGWDWEAGRACDVIWWGNYAKNSL